MAKLGAGRSAPGMATQEALATLAQCMPMRVFSQRVTRLQARISHGEALAHTIFLEKTYSKLLGSMVAVSEKSGHRPYLLGRCQRLLAEEMRIIKPFVTVMLSGLIALLVPVNQVLQSL